jgi:hypothetical protein
MSIANQFKIELKKLNLTECQKKVISHLKILI